MTPEEKEKEATYAKIEKEYAAKRDAVISDTSINSKFIANPFIDENDLRLRLSINPAAPLTRLSDTLDGIDTAAYMGMKPPTFELNGTIDVKTLIRNGGKNPEDIIEFPFPIHIPRASRSDENQFNIIKESVKYLREYREVLQMLASKNILVKGHFGMNNLSFSLSDEEIDKFMRCLENLDKGE